MGQNSNTTKLNLSTKMHIFKPNPYLKIKQFSRTCTKTLQDYKASDLSKKRPKTWRPYRKPSTSANYYSFHCCLHFSDSQCRLHCHFHCNCSSFGNRIGCADRWGNSFSAAECEAELAEPNSWSTCFRDCWVRAIPRVTNRWIWNRSLNRNRKQCRLGD